MQLSKKKISHTVVYINYLTIFALFWE